MILIAVVIAAAAVVFAVSRFVSRHHTQNGSCPSPGHNATFGGDSLLRAANFSAISAFVLHAEMLIHCRPQS